MANSLLCVVDMTSSAPTVTHLIPGRTPVSGVTSLGNYVFVVRRESQQVSVYDSVTFTLQRRLPVLGLGESCGLAACASNKCLYASDFRNDRVHRVDLSGSNAVTQWSVGRVPVSLTVSSDKNVLVVIEDGRKLQQFTTHGTQLRTIQLQPDIELPRQAIQLSSGQFVISHSGGTQHRVCLVDDKGAVVRSFGGTPGSDLTEMRAPAGLAVDEHGNILVADQDNSRLLVLDPTLTSARKMSVSVDGGLNRPYSLRYDKSRGRLYHGECGGKRVIIIHHSKHFTAPQV